MADAAAAAADEALVGLTQALTESNPAEVEIDEPEEQSGLDEKAGDQVLDRTATGDALHSVTCNSFDAPELALPPALLKGLFEMKFVRPSRIQAASLPKIWAGRNLLAQSHNGTGKTACFVLGMLKAVATDAKPQALCLCPTRELAKQISAETLKMGKYLLAEQGFAVKTILREERFERGQLMREQIVIGTPGKIWTLIGMRVLDTSAIKVLVLDEADEMLMLGGLGDMTKRIRQKLPKNVRARARCHRRAHLARRARRARLSRDLCPRSTRRCRHSSFLPRGPKRSRSSPKRSPRSRTTSGRRSR